MKRFLIGLVAVAVLATTASAGPIRNAVARVRGAVPHVGIAAAVSAGPLQGAAALSVGGGDGVQWKADAQARSGRCFHPGGGFVPGASYEGVGFSSASPQDALNHCCNNGGRVLAQAVSRGPNGWYAVKQYSGR